GLVRQKFLVPRARSAENELVYEQMVTDQKRAFHGRGRNLECLHHKTGAKERQNHGNQQRLHVLRKRRPWAVTAVLVPGWRRAAFWFEDCAGFGHSALVATSGCCCSRSSAKRAAFCSASFLVLPWPLARNSPSDHTST